MILALDVGEKRIGVATGNSIVSVASPLVTLDRPDTFITDILALLTENNSEQIVVGLPRNMEGEETKQTAAVRDFVEQLTKQTELPIAFQDESLTSVEAERRLAERGGSFEKGDIDKEAAAIILQDYLEMKR